MTSVARRREQDDSGEYSDASQDIEQNNSGNDGGQHESDYDSQGSDSEHSEGDPEKQETERRVDDDEDRSNPQYIPKRGTFYEHDDRTAASGEETTNTTSDTASEKKEGSEAPTERRRPPRKSETLNKWSHDKYNENEQIPKSRDELVSIYGYDIRNEDAPPHARRNRRYGRGPNKYTRTWEDEEAYKRQSIQPPPRKPPSPADFPELNAVNKPGRRPRARPRSKSQPTSNESSENGSQLRRNASIKTPKQKPIKQNTPKTAPKQTMKDKIPLENLTITTVANNNNQGHVQRKVNATVAQQRPVPTEQKKKPVPTQTQPQNNSAPKQQPQQQKSQQQQNAQQQAAGGAEPRGGSKRYSSLRQRPLAETYAPQQQQQQLQQQQQHQQQQQQQQQKQHQQQPQPLPLPQQTQMLPQQSQSLPQQSQSLPQQSQSLPQQPQQPPPQAQQQPPQQQNQQPQPQPHRYHGEFPSGPPAQHQGSPGPQMHPSQIMHPQVHRNAPPAPHGPSPPHPPHAQQQVRLGILDQQMVTHPHHTIHNMPQPHSIPQIPPSQGYAPPAMMPAQYMQQGGSGNVFGAAPLYQPPAAYPHPQMYPHHNYATQAGGVTYYSCAEQEQPPRAQRRPTAAIPIVRPAHAQPDRPANSSEKDNIDRIVENMFVRKPWPATHGADASKDKPQENRSSQEPQSKEPSQPNSLTSSSISTDSKSERTERTEKVEKSEKPEESEERTDEAERDLADA